MGGDRKQGEGKDGKEGRKISDGREEKCRGPVNSKGTYT